MNRGKLIRYDYGMNKKFGFAFRVEDETERLIVFEDNKGDIISVKPLINLVLEAYSDDVPTISRKEIEHIYKM